jgi:hypothetical protein
MKTRKKGRVDEKFWSIITGVISEKTGETKTQVLERIAERATTVQSRRRLRRHSSTNRSGDTASTPAQVVAKART